MRWLLILFVAAFVVLTLGRLIGLPWIVRFIFGLLVVIAVVAVVVRMPPSGSRQPPER